MIPTRLELRNFLAYRAPEPIDFEGIELFGVFSADGTQVAVAHSRNEAIGWALAKDLETANVH